MCNQSIRQKPNWYTRCALASNIDWFGVRGAMSKRIHPLIYKPIEIVAKWRTNIYTWSASAAAVQLRDAADMVNVTWLMSETIFRCARGMQTKRLFGISVKTFIFFGKCLFYAPSLSALHPWDVYAIYPTLNNYYTYICKCSCCVFLRYRNNVFNLLRERDLLN